MTNFGNQLQNYAQGNSDKCLHPIRWVDSDNLCHQCNQYVPTHEAIDTQAACIATLEAENARLTAANESMQEDAVQNTYAFGLMLQANKEQVKEITALKSILMEAETEINIQTGGGNYSELLGNIRTALGAK